MPRSQSFDVDLEKMPRYVAAALGLPRDWMVKGRCHPTNNPGDARHRTRVWFSDDSSLPGKEQERLRELALAECRICPAQWDCVTFGIKSNSTSGIWAVDKDDRQGLSNHPRWEEFIEMARVAEVSVHNVIVQLREAGQMSPRKRHTARLRVCPPDRTQTSSSL